jgi:hypothetical protein
LLHLLTDFAAKAGSINHISETEANHDKAEFIFRLCDHAAASSGMRRG